MSFSAPENNRDKIKHAVQFNRLVQELYLPQNSDLLTPELAAFRAKNKNYFSYFVGTGLTGGALTFFATNEALKRATHPKVKALTKFAILPSIMAFVVATQLTKFSVARWYNAHASTIEQTLAHPVYREWLDAGYEKKQHDK